MCLGGGWGAPAPAVFSTTGATCDPTGCLSATTSEGSRPTRTPDRRCCSDSGSCASRFTQVDRQGSPTQAIFAMGSTVKLRTHPSTAAVVSIGQRRGRVDKLTVVLTNMCSLTCAHGQATCRTRRRRPSQGTYKVCCVNPNVSPPPPPSADELVVAARSGRVCPTTITASDLHGAGGNHFLQAGGPVERLFQTEYLKFFQAMLRLPEFQPCAITDAASVLLDPSSGVIRAACKRPVNPHTHCSLSCHVSSWEKFCTAGLLSFTGSFRRRGPQLLAERARHGRRAHFHPSLVWTACVRVNFKLPPMLPSRSSCPLTRLTAAGHGSGSLRLLRLSMRCCRASVPPTHWPGAQHGTAHPRSSTTDAVGVGHSDAPL